MLFNKRLKKQEKEELETVVKTVADREPTKEDAEIIKHNLMLYRIARTSERLIATRLYLKNKIKRYC